MEGRKENVLNQNVVKRQNKYQKQLKRKHVNFYFRLNKKIDIHKRHCEHKSYKFELWNKHKQTESLLKVFVRFQRM